MLKDDTIICRCEDITYGEIVKAIEEDGLSTIDELRRVLRCAMGRCQGKTCERLIRQIIARKTGKPISEIKSMTYRPPLKPIAIGILADVE